MAIFRSLLVIFSAAFAAMIYWAVQTGEFWAEGSWLTSNPWGIVSLTDLYLGFLATAVFMYLLEGPKIRWFWILPLPFLGNVWTLLWLAYRLPVSYDRLRQKELV
jgi:hypothetical protein